MLNYGLYILVFLVSQLLPNRNQSCELRIEQGGQVQELTMQRQGKDSLKRERWLIRMGEGSAYAYYDDKRQAVYIEDAHPLPIDLYTLVSLPKRRTNWRRLEQVNPAYSLDNTYHKPIRIERDARRERRLVLKQEQGFLFPNPIAGDSARIVMTWRAPKEDK